MYAIRSYYGRIHTGLHIVAHAVAAPGPGHALFPAHVDHDGATAAFHSKEGCQRLQNHILLVAEAPADVWLNNAHLSPVHSDSLPYYAAYNVWNLC